MTKPDRLERGLRPCGRRFAAFRAAVCRVLLRKRRPFGRRKACFWGAEAVLRGGGYGIFGGKYRQKNVKTSYFIAQNAAMRRNIRNVRQLRLHAIFARICARRPFIFQRRPSHASRKFNV